LGHGLRHPTHDDRMVGCPACLPEIAGAFEKIGAVVAGYKKPTRLDQRTAITKRLAHHTEAE